MLYTDGSSPRLWGIQQRFIYCNIRGRFIPTPVGHTTLLVPGRLSISVHPHACGAYAVHFNQFLHSLGSSPRLWGILCNESRSLLIRAVHPHTCGAYAIVRGYKGDCPRFIPTPVGHTYNNQPSILYNRFIPTPVGHTVFTK